MGAVVCGEGMNYVLFLSNVEGHNREKRERFFLSIRQLFEDFPNTSRWNGARAHELMLFPKMMPEDCSCRWCRFARENQLGSRWSYSGLARLTQRSHSDGNESMPSMAASSGAVMAALVSVSPPAVTMVERASASEGAWSR